MKFGAHVSIAGGIENAPLRAKQAWMRMLSDVHPFP